MSDIDLSFLDEAFENIPIEELFEFVSSYKFEVNIKEAENCLFEEFLQRNDPVLLLNADIPSVSSSSLEISRPSDFYEKTVEEEIQTIDENESNYLKEINTENLEGIEDEEDISDEETAEIDDDSFEMLPESDLKDDIDPQIDNHSKERTENDLSIKNYLKTEYDSDTDDVYENETIVQVTTISRISDEDLNINSPHTSRLLHPKMSQMFRPSSLSNDLMDLEQESFNEDYLEDLSEDQIDDYEAAIVRMKSEHIMAMEHFQVELFEIELCIKELKNAKLGMEIYVTSENTFFIFLNNLNQKCSNLLEKYRLGNSKLKVDLKEIQKRVMKKEEMSGVLMPVDYLLLEIEVEKDELIEKDKIKSCFAHRFDEYNSKKKSFIKKNKIWNTKLKLRDRWLEVKEQQKIVDDQKKENERIELKIKSLQEKLCPKSFKLSKYSAPSAFQYILLSDALRETEMNLEKEKRLNGIMKMKITNAKMKCQRMRKY